MKENSKFFIFYFRSLNGDQRPHTDFKKKCNKQINLTTQL